MINTDWQPEYDQVQRVCPLLNNSQGKSLSFPLVVILLFVTSRLLAEDILLSANPDLLLSTANDYGPAGAPESYYSLTNDYGPLGSPDVLHGVANEYGEGLETEIPTFGTTAMKVRISANPDLYMSTANDYGPAGAPESYYSVNNDYGPNGAPEFRNSVSNDYGSGLRITIPSTFITPVWEPIDITQP